MTLARDPAAPFQLSSRSFRERPTSDASPQLCDRRQLMASVRRRDSHSDSRRRRDSRGWRNSIVKRRCKIVRGLSMQRTVSSHGRPQAAALQYFPRLRPPYSNTLSLSNVSDKIIFKIRDSPLQYRLSRVRRRTRDGPRGPDPPTGAQPHRAASLAPPRTSRHDNRGRW